MRDFRDAKAMAQTLRDELKAKGVCLTHSDNLELVAKVLGFHDWNTLAAKIQSEDPSLVTQPGTTIPATAKPTLPTGAGLPTVPLRDIVLFPNTVVPLYAGRGATIRALGDAMAGDKRILAVTQRRPADDAPTPDALYNVGVIASVIDLVSLDDGTMKLIVRALERAAIIHFDEGEFLTADTAPIQESRGEEEAAFNLSRAVLEKLQAHHNIDFLSSPFVYLSRIRSGKLEPSVLADAIAPLLSAGIDKKQELLETSDVVTRLEKIIALMNTDRQPAKLTAEP
ncbi:MAG TPA: LON peptidase substrate-binding domain-containing protein [Xanthobacteraceae bacterium]|nr:LON peptidase substrate-binding domain-containing protein [Xanthobacteraceae bacterium]